MLKNSKGEIDVNLPISGSLNDPQFSLGGVIFKVIGNLIMKAVTAPFSLLTGAFGGGDEQGAVVFDAGRSTLSKAAQEQLDKTAKALMAQFKSVGAVKEATPDQLENTPGVGKQTAQTIYEYFHE